MGNAPVGQEADSRTRKEVKPADRLLSYGWRSLVEWGVVLESCGVDFLRGRGLGLACEDLF